MLSRSKITDAARTELQPDAKLAAAAARLPELRREVDTQQGQRALLDGRRESLLEGKEKLAEGICPVLSGTVPQHCRDGTPRCFQQPHRGAGPQNAELDEQTRNSLPLQLKDAEAAEKELDSRAIRLQELDKQALAWRSAAAGTGSGRPGWRRL